MTKIRITRIKSTIGSAKVQKRTVEALGLIKIGTVVEKVATPQILGMVHKVNHLVRVEEIKD